MNNRTTGTTGLVHTILSLILSVTNCLVSIVVLATIVYHCHRDHTKRSARITLMLSTHIYLLIFGLMIICLSINIQTVLGDLYGHNFNSPRCRFQRYLLGVLGSCLYNSFVVQI